MATTIEVQSQGPVGSAPVAHVVRVESDTDRIIMVILLIFFPPLAVMFKDGGCSKAACLNIILLFLLVFPAYCHAVYHCFIRDRKNEVRTQVLG
ncbi:unnamed protein product [Caenorhabditis auriculariae]|uniref:Uncharacterized protein n=1 Tax=Caenorhabditis auriculariae TaxID=2777116 RepID=A0A8S1GN36_9PELO|nr:unnamed protein product [Caenorhabditis auriculariae]